MLIRSITATTALALIAVAAAEPEPDRLRIYFPREVKREYSNSSIPTTDTLSKPESLDNATPGNVEVSPSTTTSTTSSRNGSRGPTSDLQGRKTASATSSQYGDTTVSRVSPPVDQDTRASPTVVVTSKLARTSSSPKSKSDPNPQDGSTSSTSDVGIVIAPTGIVAPSSSSRPSSRTGPNEPITTSRKPTATGAESITPTAPNGETYSPPKSFSTTLFPSKGGITDTGSVPASITTSRRGISDFPGTGVTPVVTPSSAEAPISSPLNPVVTNPSPASLSETAHSGSTMSPPTTPIVGTSPEPSNTIVKPDTIVAPTGGVVPVVTSKPGSSELPKTTSVGPSPATTPYAGTAPESSNTIVKPDTIVAPTGGVVPVLTSKTGSSELSKISSVSPTGTTNRPGTTRKTGASAPVESSASSLVPITSSVTSASNPLETVISNVLPGPTSANSTAMSTESTLPPPIAVLPTGYSPTAAVPSKSTGLPSSGDGVPAETATTMSPNTSLVPSPSSVLPVDSTSDMATQSSIGITPNTTAVEVSTSAGGSVPIVTDPSATVTATSKIPEVSVVNSTTPETATAAPTYTNTPSAPSEIPVVNSTVPADRTSLPTGPVTLPPSSSGGVKSTSPTYAAPESSTSKSISSPSFSSQPSSAHTGAGSPSRLSSPIDSSTVRTTPSRAPPATTPIQTESKPTQPPAPATPTSSAPPSPPTTASTPKLFPTGVPKYFTPKDSDLLPPRDTENITIGFRNVVSPQYPNDNGATFNFSQKAIALLPAALSLSFNSTITDQIRVFRVEVCHDQPQWGSAIALVSFPNGQGMISKLQMDLAFPSSPVYNSGNSTLNSVTSKIDSTFNVLSKYCSGGTTGGGAVPGDGGNTPSDTKPPTDSFGNPVGDDKPNRQSVRTTSFIVVGAVSFGVMYGAAMFVLARRYKRKKQSHRRSNSVTNSQNSSEMRYTGGASPALMGGALLSREHFNYGAGGRDSRGSGRSGMGNSGRTANISAPVAAENSLGWN